MTKNNSDNYLTTAPKSDIIEKTMSGGDKMADKGVLNTPINKEVLDNFRTKCKEENIPMNVVIEVFCREFAKGAFELKFGKTNTIELTDELTSNDNTDN